MRAPGRFELKILGAILLVASMTVATGVFVMRFGMRKIVDYSIERQRQMGIRLRHVADVFRADFDQRKSNFELRADQLAKSPPESVQLLADEPGLLRARILQSNRVIEQWEASPALRALAKEAPPEMRTIASSTGAPPRLIELTFGLPRAVYEDWDQLRSELEREVDQRRAYDAVVPEYVTEYLKFVLGVLALGAIIGSFFARRTSIRLLRLRDAARRVGAGDLTVVVAPKGKDELDELGRAFDRMVLELADARSRLEYLQKVSAWQEVARRLAHEIKNPLTPIQLSVQELVMKYRGDDPQYRKLLDTADEILREEITGLRRLVDDFSAFAKLPKVDPQPLDLGALVSDFVRQHPEWERFTTVTLDRTTVTAPCDKTLFRRVLANLVENAVQAATAAGRTPEVKISVASGLRGGRAAVVVDDNGPGVPAELRARVFDPYVTHKEGGTGLGLAIVRKILIDHGGDVFIVDAPPPLGGARFIVEIPT